LHRGPAASSSPPANSAPASARRTCVWAESSPAPPDSAG
jgi:hypothetical protein